MSPRLYQASLALVAGALLLVASGARPVVPSGGRRDIALALEPLRRRTDRERRERRGERVERRGERNERRVHGTAGAAREAGLAGPAYQSDRRQRLLAGAQGRRQNAVESSEPFVARFLCEQRASLCVVDL